MRTFLLLFFALISFTNTFSQQDSLNNQVDSAILVQEQKSTLIKLVADSINKVDSIFQLSLEQELAQLRSRDLTKRKEIQVRIDSIKNAQLARDNKIKKEIDSLKTNTKGVPVMLFNDTMFFIYAKLGPISPSERAGIISKKLENLVKTDLFNPEKLISYPTAETVDIIHEDIIILSLTDRDAFWYNSSKEKLGNNEIQLIKSAISTYQKENSLKNTLTRFGLLLGVILFFVLGITYMNKGLTLMVKRILLKSKSNFTGLTFKNYEYLSLANQLKFLAIILKVAKWLIILTIVYFALPIVFSIFPSTKGIATTLINYVVLPLKASFHSIVNFIPRLFTIVVIVTITRYFIKLLRFISNEISTGKLKLNGFYPDWATPTFNLIKVITYAFSFVIIFPYLPGSDSPIFKGVSVFFGLLISLGSSSAIGNIIAGLVITYMRAFIVGDRVKIGDVTGDVIEKTLLVTRLRTIKNEEITIPNAAILAGSTINYSTLDDEIGLILNTSVTIGYDVPWRKVHELLMKAATKTEFVNSNPAPFVLQTSLDDFYVSYQLNAYTNYANKAATIYSAIHANIQDLFNENGVEIMSPHYKANRDGNHVTIPNEYLDEKYEAPTFNVKLKK
jgi:small-conductance mechanosensitive channel